MSITDRFFTRATASGADVLELVDRLNGGRIADTGAAAYIVDKCEALNKQSRPTIEAAAAEVEANTPTSDDA